MGGGSCGGVGAFTSKAHVERKEGTTVSVMPPLTTPKTKKETAQLQQRRDRDDGDTGDAGDGLLPPIDTTRSPAAPTAATTPTSTKPKRKKFTKKKKAELKEEFRQGPGLSQPEIHSHAQNTR